jgi:hypothetical protein
MRTSLGTPAASKLSARSLPGGSATISVLVREPQLDARTEGSAST